MTDLTLWHIEAELSDLVNLRDQMAEAGEDLAPIEQTIREYVGRELRKVDGIRAYLKHAEMMVHAAQNEANLQKERANVWQSRIDRLKEFCRATMDTWGAKRLDGATGSLILKGNGGRPAVTITDASLIPEDYVQYTGTISGEAWESLQSRIVSAENWERWAGRQDVQMDRIPHKGRIGAALSGVCPRCDGHPDLLSVDEFPAGCPLCDNDGLVHVPGARLEPRGNHIEIK